MQAIADLVGLTSGQLIVIIVAAIILLIVWTLIRQALKMAARVFAIGLLFLIAVIAVLYVVFFLSAG